MSFLPDVGLLPDLGFLPPLTSWPDTAELDAIAQRITEHARVARARAVRLDHVLAGTTWHGAAASSFGDQAGYVLFGLRSSAARLDEAAEALRRHAARVRVIADSLASVQSTVTSALEGLDGVTAGVGGLAHLVGIG